ncbi:MAG: dihydrofolate reductase family protein [Pseudomonadota bacterium]
MPTGHVFMAVSLDGFIARTDGGLDWLMKQDTEGEDHGYDSFIASVDGIVMGRASFEKVLTFSDWPYHKPVVVMSRTLGAADIPAKLRNKVALSTHEPKQLMHELDRKGWKRAYIDGGKVVQSFLGAGLVSDLTNTHIPKLIGTGLPLFCLLDRDIDLALIESRSFPFGLVTSKYRVRKPDRP